jgi:uncharacterized protein YjdB
MTIKINPGITLGPGVTVKVPVLPVHTLTVTKLGTGNGLVVSTPAGISTVGSASATFPVGTEVTLTASPAPGRRFVGWGGAASGTGIAVITMDQDQTVTVRFELNATIVSIAVTPTDTQLPYGFTTQMTATALFSNGSSSDYTDLVTWSSTGEEVATVDSNGLVTGVAMGTVSIRASYGPVLGTTTLAVTDATLVAIGITPSPAAVARGDTLQLTAVGTFADASTLDITSQSTWSSANDLVATVDTNGLATGVSGGSATIHATTHGIQGNLTLFVGN